MSRPLSYLRSNRTLLVPVTFGLGSAVYFTFVGIPLERDTLFAWLLIGLMCFSLTDLQGYIRGVVRDWLPFFAILVAYDWLRGAAGRLPTVHYLPQIQFDRILFGGQIPTVTLQRWLWHGTVTWFDVLMWLVYISHFFVTPILAAILWKLDRKRFRRFTLPVIALSFAGLATYALFPAAPPWMASQRHLIAPITRIIPAVWAALPIHETRSLVEGGYRYANNVAAVPSLHAAFSLLVAITIWPRRRRWLRPIVVAYPLAMAFAIVYTGEHYVFDVLLGWLYTVAVVLALAALTHRRATQRVPVPAIASSSIWPAPVMDNNTSPLIESTGRRRGATSQRRGWPRAATPEREQM